MTDRYLYGGLIRLHLLHHASARPLYGLAMIEALARHGYRLSPGTLYPILHGLEEKGYLRSTERRLGLSYHQISGRLSVDVVVDPPVDLSASDLLVNTTMIAGTEHGRRDHAHAMWIAAAVIAQLSDREIHPPRRRRYQYCRSYARSTPVDRPPRRHPIFRGSP